MSEFERLLNDVFFKKTIGFDWLNMTVERSPSTFPPCNIVKTDDTSYVITFAVVGFGEDDIDIEVKDNMLTITGKIKDTESEKTVVYIHKGIATRQFKQSFTLDRFIEVKEASMSNGMLNIHLVRDIPEEKKPKKIEVKSDRKKLLLG